MGRKSREKAERRATVPVLPPAEERQRLVHAVVRAVRGIITNDHDRQCLLYCTVGKMLLDVHLSPDYHLQVGHVMFGTDASNIPDHMCGTQVHAQGYHTWLARRHRHGRVEVVDFSWGFFPRWAAHVGLTWGRPDMPSYLWDWVEGIGLRPKRYDIAYGAKRDLCRQIVMPIMQTPEFRTQVQHAFNTAQAVYEYPHLELFTGHGLVPVEDPWEPMADEISIA
jgi:hypothetical protein